MNFSEMTKQEKLAFCQFVGQSLIALYLNIKLSRYIHLDGMTLTTIDGILSATLEVIILSLVVELVAGFVRRRPSNEVAIDERDRDIRARATGFAMKAFCYIAAGAIFTAGATSYFLIRDIETRVLATLLVDLMVIVTILQHGAAPYLYRRG